MPRSLDGQIHSFSRMCADHNVAIQDISCPARGCTTNHGYCYEPCSSDCPQYDEVSFRGIEEGSKVRITVEGVLDCLWDQGKEHWSVESSHGTLVMLQADSEDKIEKVD